MFGPSRRRRFDPSSGKEGGCFPLLELLCLRVALTLECVPCFGDACSGMFSMFGLPSALAALADGAERASEMVFEAGLSSEQRVRVHFFVS